MNLLASADTGFEIGLLATALVFGLRHGIDWDHIAALADITSLRQSQRSALVLATLYAVGHAVVVFGLGLLAIVAGSRLPAGVDRLMERFVGLSLIAMGIYVLYSLIRNRRNFRIQSSWGLLLRLARRALSRARERADSASYVEIEHDHEHAADGSHGHEHADVLVPASSHASSAVRLHRHPHRHGARMPPDPFVTYGPGTSLALGMLHGIGAETPTQLLLFVTAAGAGGRASGVLLLGAFVVGLLVSNSLLAVASIFGFRSAERSFVIYAALAILAAVFSLMAGTLFLLGEGGRLPAILGG